MSPSDPSLLFYRNSENMVDCWHDHGRHTIFSTDNLDQPLKSVVESLPLAVYMTMGQVQADQSTINLDAFKQLLRLLKDVGQQYFSLQSWVDSYPLIGSGGPFGPPIALEDPRPKHLDIIQKYENLEHANSLNTFVTECGTTACACGHAGFDPWFMDRGFKWDPTKMAMMYTNPHTKEVYEDHYAAMQFFGITLTQFYWLFTEESNYKSLDHVMARIDSFVNGVEHVRAEYHNTERK